MLFSNYKPAPPEFAKPPPLPKFDPKEEEPKWWWGRMMFGAPMDRTGWTKIGEQPAGDDKPDWRGVVKNNVIPLPDPGPYPYGQPNDRRYYFFDTPDYADPFKKLGFANRVFLQAGSFWAISVAILHNYKFNLENHIKLISKYILPVYLSGMAASATAIAVANLRGNKDDQWNWLAAGIAAGTVFGHKNYVKWFRAQIFCIPLALGMKRLNEENSAIAPVVNFRLPFYYLSGAPADNGWRSGDLRLGIRGRIEDPGRDQRRYAL